MGITATDVEAAARRRLIELHRLLPRQPQMDHLSRGPIGDQQVAVKVSRDRDGLAERLSRTVHQGHESAGRPSNTAAAPYVSTFYLASHDTFSEQH